MSPLPEGPEKKDSGKRPLRDHQSETEDRADELEDFFREHQERKEALPKK